MVTSVRHVGENRFREPFGRYYEDFEVGHVYEHRPARTVPQPATVWFTLLTMNTHPLHFDKVYAATTEFGQPLVNSTLTVAILVGMSVSDVSQKVVADLGWKDINRPPRYSPVTRFTPNPRSSRSASRSHAPSRTLSL